MRAPLDPASSRSVVAASGLRAVTVAVLAVACQQGPTYRLTTAADARAPDGWLQQDGARCQDKVAAGDVRVQIEEPGIGDPVRAGETVRVHYAAFLASGEKVHDTHNGLPHEMVIGSTHTICGFEKALLGMLPGEKRRAFVPWDIGFGQEGRGPSVPPQADLVFVIDLFLPGGAEAGVGSGPVRPAGGRRR